MGNDGANLGVSAGRALGTILGGDPHPTDDEKESIEEMEKTIRATPLFEGEPPFQSEGDDAYSLAANCIAHAFLVLADEDPTIMEDPGVYTEEDLKDSEEYMKKAMLGKAKDPSEIAWKAMMARWPHADEWIGGASGFMVGWAYNAARTIKSLPPVSNPAIIEIGVPDGET